MLRKRWSQPKAAARSAAEIAALERAGRIVAEALRAAAAAATAPTATTADVDAAAGEVIRRSGGTPLFRGYRQGSSPPFPADCCVSVNEEVVHGIPSTSRALRPGDLVSVDVGVKLDGWCGDSATSVLVPGEPAGAGARGVGRDAVLGASTRRRLIDTTRRVLDRAVASVRPGVMWSTIGAELERLTLDAGLAYVTEYVGHGIGRELHEPPKAPSYWTGYTGADFELQTGMVLAIEPLLVAGVGAGRADITVSPDGWTVRAPEHAVACHEEYMVAVTAQGARVLSDGGRAEVVRG